MAPLAAAGLFGLVSGFNDGGNLMASFTSGRLITPRVAALLLPVSVAGPLVLGTAVAQTVGTNVIDLRGQGGLDFVLITLSSISVVLLSWRFGVPTSMTLALVGAMLGWVAVNGQLGLIHWGGVARILFGMPISVFGGGLLVGNDNRNRGRRQNSTFWTRTATMAGALLELEQATRNA